MSIVADHIAVLMMEIANRNNGRYSYFASDLQGIISDTFGIVIPTSISDAVAERLLVSGAATKLVSPLTGDLFQVDPKNALQFYEADAEPSEHTTTEWDRRWHAAQANEIFRTFYFGGDAWLNRAIEALKQRNLIADEAEQDIADNAVLVPASDRIVSVDHNAPEAQIISDGLPELQELIRKDNSDRIGNPADRPRFVEQLKAAGDLLRLDRISTRAVAGLILPVLTYLALKFGDEAIGQLATALLEALKSWLGISF
ncbi:hypothetical protein [Sphingomonas sp. KR3-1]|uniref:hypothetical protein n=1 Tax=Sphingomonas sp. KR3-1 TaxID=3156611 RepID=UPI0032B36528